MTDTTGVDHPAIRDSYDRVASAYAEQYSDELTGRPLDRALLAAFAEQAPPGLPLADIGCGPGHVAAHLAALGRPVVGVDLSPGMVQAAAARHPSLDFQVGSMLALAAPDGAYAGVVSLYTLIHLPAAERAAAIAEFARVLCPGGLLLVSVHIDGPMGEVGDVVRMRTLLDLPVTLDFHFIDPHEIAAACEDAGLVVQARMDRVPYPEDVPTRRSYILAGKPAAP
jgi:SAM-dependent methyltransferase